MCNLSSSRCGLVSKFQPRPRPWPWERRLLLPLARCRTRSSHGRRSAHAPRCRRRLRPRRLRLRRQREPTTAAAPPLRPRALERLIHYPLSRRTTILADGYPIMSGSGSLISPVTRAYSKRQRLRWRGRSQVTHCCRCVCVWCPCRVPHGRTLNVVVCRTVSSSSVDNYRLPRRCFLIHPYQLLTVRQL